MLLTLQGLQERYSQGFVLKLDRIEHGIHGYVPKYHFDLSKKWDYDDLINLLLFDMEAFVTWGFHEIDNVWDIINFMPAKDLQFYSGLLKRMEVALSNRDGNLFYELAEQWPGLFDEEE